MKISFSHPNTNETLFDNVFTHNRSKAKNTEKADDHGYIIDLDNSMSSQGVYKNENKSKEDIRLQALGKNVDVMQDYMTVMSNTLSDEDFASLAKNGYNPAEVEVKDAVTIVDKIKATLIESGVEIKGYTDDIDRETLEKITKNTGLAMNMISSFQEENVPLTENTAEQITELMPEVNALSELSEGSKKYLLENELPSTVENLYKAQFSSTGQEKQSPVYYLKQEGYVFKQADQIDWTALDGQMHKIIEASGLTDREGIMESAKWLVEKGIPLNEDTLKQISDLQEISFPIDEKKLMNAIAIAVSDGKSPLQADLSQTESVWDQAEQIYENVQSISAEAADLTEEDGKKINIKNLLSSQKKIEHGIQPKKNQVKARRQLEEVRLQMTVSANRELIKSGYKIETEGLEQLVEALKKAENTINQRLFDEETIEEANKDASLYQETLDAVKEIPYLPISVSMVALRTSQDFTINTVIEHGHSLAYSYQKAEESYETFATEVRKDLGDSIKKAFQNAPDILKEMSLEATESNLRAVRILGYNHTEITETNINRIKTADQSIQNVIDSLTPAATLKMIRDGKNPLEMNIYEMDDYLTGQELSSERDTEKYSKFLYKLEQNHEITPEEKESYIGIYRLIRQIEKSDGAVIGALVNQGAELSFKNMLSAVRSQKAKGMDFTADDETGFNQGTKIENSISNQIGSAFNDREDQKNEHPEQNGEYEKRLARKVYHDLDGDTVTQLDLTENLTLEKISETLMYAQSNQELEKKYWKEEIKQIRNLTQTQQESVEYVEKLDEPVTAGNLIAMQEYTADPNGLNKKIREKAQQQNMDLKESISMVEERFESELDAKEAIKNWIDKQKEVLEEASYGEGETISSVDVRQMGLLYKQISFSAKIAEKEQYEIPILTNDSCLTLHLRIMHDPSESGRVEASMDTEKYGKISVSMNVEEKNIDMILMATDQNADTDIVNISSAFEQKVRDMGYELTLNTGYKNDIQALPQILTETKNTEGSVNEKENIKDDSKPATGMLYQIAKAFIVAVSEEIGRN